jgi:signal transduction histidine kinase/ligand-binding sensor domain-containing protein/CheY-like chemotaxis protein
MWFGTDEGLNRYDGYEVKVYKKKLADSTSLCDNQVICLYVDSKSRLWVGTLNGLSLYNEKGDNFINYLPESLNRNINTINRVTGIYEDKDCNILFNTEIGRLYSIENNKVKKLIDLQKQDNIRCHLQDKEGNLWFGGMKGIMFFDKRTGRIDEIRKISKDENIDVINKLLENGDQIWAGSNSGQLIQINKSNRAVTKFKIPNVNLGFVFDIKKDNNGFIYVATAEGLHVFSKDQNKYFEYHHQPNNPYGLNSESVTSIYFDKNYNLWLGTVQGGVNYSLVNKHFSNYNFFSKWLHIDVSGIQSICIDSKNNWWLGSYYKGINIINPHTGLRKIIMPQETNPYSLSKGSVLNIFEDSKKRMWVGVYMGYLQEYIPSKNSFKSYTFSELNTAGKKAYDIRSIYEESDGNFWIISHSVGLIHLNTKTGKARLYSHDPLNLDKSLADDFAYQIVKQKKTNYLWIATPSGISRFNTKTEEFQNYFLKENDKTSLSNNHINSIYIDSEDNIWVGTFFGLNLYNKNTDSFYHYYVNDGLPSNQIKSIIEERPGKLWLGTGFGLTCMQFNHIDFTKGRPVINFRNYDKGDNLQDIFFWERSVAKDASGRLIFGTENGIIAFYPSQITDNTKAPEVYFTDFLLFNNKINIGAKDSILPQNIENTTKIKLNYTHKIITFKFVAINYIAPEKTQYAYKMEGFDKDWNYVGNKREATYTNLDPGTYTFKVIASNNDGYWNRTGRSITIEIQPPFWRTWWFRICLILLVAAGITFFYYFRFSFYRKQQAKLTRMVIDRTLDLQEITANLEERQEEIKQQNEELSSQRDALAAANTLLSKQKQQILEQNQELYRHRNELESLVTQRTHELLIAKEKAEESDKLKSSFLANLSHEIRTPLNAIIGFSTIIADEDVEPHERSSYKQIIQNSGFSLLSLIDDIIDFSKIEAGHINIIVKETPLARVLENVKQIYNFQLKRQQIFVEKKIDFKIMSADDNNIILKTDENRLNQVLTNLINNAIKFTNDGFIEIGYQLINRNQNIQFYVKDSGIGIKKEHQKIIFERFRKIEENENQIHRGAGLGLAISYQLVNLLGGSIWVESEENKGATFFFTIPLIKQEEVSKDLSFNSTLYDISNNVPDLQNHKIIIAEDDQANFAYINKLIQRTKASVIHAETGLQVLNLLENLHDNISLILMDIKMPDLNGIDTLKEIRRRNIQIPVMAQTAHVFSDEIRQLKEVGFDEYISKPINPGELYNKINKLLKVGV